MFPITTRHSRRNSTSGRAAYRPRLEALEDRTVPATFLVQSAADTVGGGTMTLRDAILAANANPDVGGNDTITFDTAGVFASAQTITLTNGQLPTITDPNLAITGPGQSLLTIDAQHKSQVFVINSLAASLSGLTVTNGYTLYGSGGGIYNQGTLTVSNCTISSNTSNSGGGICNQGTLTVSSCTLSSNSSNTGGGIYSQGTLTVSNCTLFGNTANEGGGGLLNTYGGALTVSNCTLSSNTADYQGGGIYNGGAAVLTNLTVANNYAGALGGGIYFYAFSTGVALTLTNTIVAGNTAPTGPDMYQYFGGTENVSYSLIGDGTASGISGGTDNQIGTSSSPIDPKLTALGYYGGPTPTLALKFSSPAIGHGTSGSGIPTTDQRGFARSGAYDIGAFQTQTGPLVVTTSADPGLLSGQLALREAINLANALGGSATITFNASFNIAHAIKLNGQLPTITDPDLTITGPGQDVLTIDAQHQSRVFTIISPATASLSGLTVTNGYALSANGGGVVNSGTLTVSNCTLASNTAIYGGGI
jgi:predicted outer membrane repeat protein